MMAVGELKDPIAVPAPVVDPEAPWYVVLTQPQQDLTTVWRLHELGLELYVPVIRKRVKTGRTGANGHKVTRVIAKPMFPGYGFLRATGGALDRVRDTRGVRDFMRNERGEFVTLPHMAVMAVYRKQNEEHQEWLAQSRARRFVPFKRGDKVKFDEQGSVYDGIISVVDMVDGRGRVQLMLGMIKHWVAMDKVVAA